MKAARPSLLLLAALTLTFLVSGCGKSDEAGAPSASVLINKTLTAMKRQPGAQVTLNASAQTSGKSLSVFNPQKVNIVASGQMGQRVILLNGVMNLQKVRLPFKLQSDDQLTTISSGKSVIYAGDGREDLGVRIAPPGSPIRAAVDNPRQMVSGSVSTSEESENYWSLEAKLNRQALVKYAKLYQIDLNNQKALPQLAENFTIEMEINKTSYLPRLIKISYDGPGRAALGFGGIIGTNRSTGTSRMQAFINFKQWGVLPRPGPMPKVNQSSLALFLYQATLTSQYQKPQKTSPTQSPEAVPGD